MRGHTRLTIEKLKTTEIKQGRAGLPLYHVALAH